MKTNKTNTNTTSAISMKIAHNVLNMHLRRLWKGARDNFSKIAQLDLNRAELIIPDRSMSFKRMYETYHKAGNVVVALELYERRTDSSRRDLDTSAAKLTPKGFDQIARLDWGTKAQFQERKNDPTWTLFLLVSPRLELSNTPKEQPCHTFERDKKNILHSYTDGNGHTYYTSDKNGYSIPSLEQRKREAHNYFSNLRHAAAIAAFDPTTRDSALKEADSRLNDIRRTLADLILTNSKFIEIIDKVENELSWHVSWSLRDIERANTATSLDTAVSAFVTSINKVSGILANYGAPNTQTSLQF